MKRGCQNGNSGTRTNHSLAEDKSLAQLHAESAKGALEDAGLGKSDIDGYFCAGDAPGLGPLSMADYMGLKLLHMDSTDSGGSSYLIHVGHAAEAIAAGKRCGSTRLAEWPASLAGFVLVTAVIIVAAFLWPVDFYYHYAAFFAPFLALAVALPVARLVRAARPVLKRRN